MMQYPVMRAVQGGGVDGLVAGLPQMLDIAVPKYCRKVSSYGGHCAAAASADQAECRDMVVIVRDRIRNLAVGGASRCNKCSRLNLRLTTTDVTTRAARGCWPTFVEAI